MGNLLLGDDVFTQMTDTAVRAPAPHESGIEMLRDDDGVVQVPRLVAVEPREAFRLWVSFADGAQGEVDMSRAPGQAPPGWFEPGFFSTARIRGAGFAVVWGDEEEWDACSEAMWLTLNGYEWDDLVDSVAR